MQSRQIRRFVEEVRGGKLPRREFIQKMVSAGLTAPMASMMLMHYGVARGQSAASPYKPAKRGGGGTLKLIWWQGPTMLQPHFASGVKDQNGARIFYEPLAAWDGDGNLSPVLAAEIPTRENGGVALDGRSVTWKLKRGVTWHDGQPFTADDCVFTWEFAKDPATAAYTSGIYKGLVVTRVDSHTIRITFPEPTPFWATAFVAAEGMVIPRHVFGPFVGTRAREAPANFKPVGTGPYKFTDFKPGDIIRGEINPNYHMPNRPFFDSIEMKGGGDSTSAARAVLQTGEYDHAWNLLVEDDVLRRMESAGKGRVRVLLAADIEMCMLNMTDPWNEVDGERANAKSSHFAFSDPAVREAMSLLIDRQSIQQFIFGRGGMATHLFLNNPARFRSRSGAMEFNVEKANTLLEAAGWKKGADGVREKGGRKLKFVFQTSINSLRQKVQTVIKQAAQAAGIDMELKTVTAAAFFSNDIANPDTFGKFWCDMQMYAIGPANPDPERFMDHYRPGEFSGKANKWLGRNTQRWTHPEYEAMYVAAKSELDPARRAALFIRMNDLIVQDRVIIPLMLRTRVRATVNQLVAPLSAWDSDLWALQDWYRET